MEGKRPASLETKYFYFADRFGWLPSQVNEQDAELLDVIQEIDNIKQMSSKHYGG